MGIADPRAALERLIRERGEDYAGLSRLIGRNPAYVQQYVKRGSPRRLAEEDRRVLARYFDVDEALLGGTTPPPTAQVAVPRLDVEASAGAGAAGAEDRALFEVAFDPRWLRRIGGDGRRVSMIEVRGDSMEPLLGDGDEILVDQDDAAGRLRDGVYVLRREGALMVKRLSPHPGGQRVSVSSDNPAYPSWPDCDAAGVDVVGRVIWAGKRIR
jgi:phage repressor protein C with HTH and peptisase S24 domain